MKTSDTIVEISKALISFQSQVETIKKTETNPFFKSKYASLADILNTIRQPLSDNKLCFVQFPTEVGGMTTRLIHESGEWFEDTYFMTPVDNKPQTLGSCITYQRRYALGSILGLNIDNDDDGNSASGKLVSDMVATDKPYSKPNYAHHKPFRKADEEVKIVQE